VLAVASAFDHARFGHAMSHGCINLSLADLSRISQFLDGHHVDGVQLAITLGLFVAGVAVSLIVAAVIVVRLPANYLRGGERAAHQTTHPVLRALLIVGKNLVGAALIAVGLVLSIPGVPGQGLLTIFIGVTLVDFPGKRWVERRILGVPAILRAVNRLRRRWGRAPLEL
jgi:hypothetical protein